MHPLLLHNDEIVDANRPTVSPGQVGLMNGWGVFSTLRVADGVLFAYERHWNRMHKDAEKMHVPFPAESSWMHERLLRLVEANNAKNATLRVAIVRNRGGVFEAPGLQRDFDLIAFTAELTRWPESVRLALKPQARHAANEFAGTKITSWSQNLTWYEEAHDLGFDEWVLLNERGEVSECTSANLFAVFGDEAATPPVESGCLAGVTRDLLLEEIRVPGVRVTERTLLPADLATADGVFMTSTTRDLLPVHSIEGLYVKSERAVLEKLRNAFLEYRQAYLGKFAYAH